MSLNSSIVLAIAATRFCGFPRTSGSFGIFFMSDVNRSSQAYSWEYEWQGQLCNIILYNFYVKLNTYLIWCSCPRGWWKNIPFLPHALDITDTLSWNRKVGGCWLSWSCSLCALQKNWGLLVFSVKSWSCRMVWLWGSAGECSSCTWF